MTPAPNTAAANATDVGDKVLGIPRGVFSQPSDLNDNKDRDGIWTVLSNAGKFLRIFTTSSKLSTTTVAPQVFADCFT